MATVKKDITEVSEKITEVKKIVKKRAEQLKEKELLQTPISEGVSWKDLKFSHPERTVRIGTVFSGIGIFKPHQTQTFPWRKFSNPSLMRNVIINASPVHFMHRLQKRPCNIQICFC